MKIPYKVIDGIIYVDARVEVSEHFLNNVPFISTTEEGGHFIMDHVRPGKPTRVFGDVALVFLEETKAPKQEDKLSIPPPVSNGIYTASPHGHVDVRYMAGNDLLKMDEVAQGAFVIGGGMIEQDRKAHIKNFYGLLTDEAGPTAKMPTREQWEKGAKEYIDKCKAKDTAENKEPTPEEWEKAIEKFKKTPLEFRTTTESILERLGFQQRGTCTWHHVLFGEDRQDNWMKFDPKTDELTSLIPKIFRSGYHKGVQTVRRDIKTALDLPLI